MKLLAKKLVSHLDYLGTNKVSTFILDNTLVGGCPYCSTIRALLVGYGMGMGNLSGAVLIVIGISLTHLEAYVNS